MLVPARARFVPTATIRPSPASAKTSVARHLIIAYRPGWQSTEDLGAIRRHVTDIDPTIETFIVPTTERNSVSRRLAAKRPTLVVSNGAIPVFRPLRGKVYQGFPIAKFEELRRLSAAGVPVPRTAMLTPDLQLDEADWGEFVIVKPTDIATSSHGRGIQLMRTRRVRYIPPAEYPADHPGRLGPMLVQQYIDTGEHLTEFRILTYFGEPLYLQSNRAKSKRVDLSLSDEEIESATVAAQNFKEQDHDFPIDPGIIALARAAHNAIPEIPLKGCDVVRDHKTGRPYVLELNCGGNTWHFSSNFNLDQRDTSQAALERRRRRRLQFDAMRTAARVLVARTNSEAE